MKERLIAITGFMGAGKTTIGCAVAEKLHLDFIDLDHQIVEREARSIAEIINEEGEPRFRQIETSVLRNVLREREEGIIALGGGTWTIAANRSLMQAQHARVIWLDVSFEICWQRISADKALRPLAPSREAAENLFQQRQAAYAIGTIRIAVDNTKSVNETVEEIVASVS